MVYDQNKIFFFNSAKLKKDVLQKCFYRFISDLIGVWYIFVLIYQNTTFFRNTIT